MPQLNMNFAVDGNSIVCNMLSGEVRGRKFVKKNPGMEQYYEENGVINSNPSITNFITNNPGIFENRKLVPDDGSTFLEGILPFSPLATTKDGREMLKRRMTTVYDLTDPETAELDSFFEGFEQLVNSSEMRKIVTDTEEYKKPIEAAWKQNGGAIIDYVKGVLGYEPETVGRINTYIMYPTFDTSKCHQLGENKTGVFFARRKNDVNQILSYLTHQTVHQLMLPYKMTMTKEEKEEFHSFIRFLTDKDVYSQLSGKSGLANPTKDESPEIMGKVYPFWLGYRYRNADKEGLDPVEQIRRTIAQDKEYYDSLSPNSKKRKLYAKYNFEKLDPEKIAILFRERRCITPYQFAKLDFDRVEDVYKDKFLRKAKVQPVSDEEEGR